VPSAPLSLESISLFFRYALSLTAWKRFHETTGRSAEPSTGISHPTEGYAVLPTITRLGNAPPYTTTHPREHALERRAILDPGAWSKHLRTVPEGVFS